MKGVRLGSEVPSIGYIMVPLKLVMKLTAEKNRSPSQVSQGPKRESSKALRLMAHAQTREGETRIL